jgi:hypothetical protein
MDLPDASKGKYFKNVFFKNTEKTNSYWTCTVNATGVTTEALAHQLLIQQLRLIRVLQVVLVFLGVVLKSDSIFI